MTHLTYTVVELTQNVFSVLCSMDTNPNTSLLCGLFLSNTFGLVYEFTLCLRKKRRVFKLLIVEHHLDANISRIAL